MQQVFLLSTMSPNLNFTVDALYRNEWGRIVATLIRNFGDFEVAEEAAQEAFAAAVPSVANRRRSRISAGVDYPNRETQSYRSFSPANPFC